MDKLSRRRNSGASMIEVLVTIVIIAFGLLGMAGLQTRMQVAELEGFQRAQALVLVNDIANKMQINRNATVGDGYVATVSPTTDCSTTFSGTTMVKLDLKEWCNAMHGSAQTTGAVGGTAVGALINARGCVESLGSRDYMITVAWQGVVPITAPPSSVTCGQNLYDDAAGTTGCTADKCRRVVTAIVRIATL